MIRASLLPILCCPDTRRPLRIADPSLLQRVNDRIKTGSCKNRGGETVSQPVVEALATDDGLLLYPVRNNVPLLLIGEGIVIAG